MKVIKKDVFFIGKSSIECIIKYDKMFIIDFMNNLLVEGLYVKKFI